MIRKPHNGRHAALARRMLQMIRDEDLPAGTHLRETALAQRFAVSRSPIRTALQVLHREGIVTLKPNSGAFLSVAGHELAGRQVEIPPTADDDLYMKIAADRYEDTLSGTVAETTMMRRYAAPRSAVRRVMTRLIEEGLAVRSPGRGWTFGAILNTPEACRASYDFRLVIEPAALVSDSAQVDPKVLATQRQTHVRLLNDGAGRLSSVECFLIDARFHEAMVGLSGNQFLIQAIRQQNLLRRLSEYRQYADWGRVQRWCREHLAVIEAIEHGERARAARMMADHLTAAREQAVATAAGRLAGGGAPQPARASGRR